MSLLTPAMVAPTMPGSVVMATSLAHPSPDHWFAQVGNRWVNPLGQFAMSWELTFVSVLHDSDPDAEVNHR